MPIAEEKTTRNIKSTKKEEKNQPGVEHEKTETPVSTEKIGCILESKDTCIKILY